MSLSKEVSKIITIHTQGLWFIQGFCKDYSSYMNQRELQELFVNVPNNIKVEYGQLMGEFIDSIEKSEDEVRESIITEGMLKLSYNFSKNYSAECVEFFLHSILEVLRTYVYPYFVYDFVYDMVLTHTITTFEAFLSDFLVAVFTGRPNTLKSQNVATFEQVLSFSSMKQLINGLAVERAKKILDGNIDKVASNLKNAFSIDITTLNGFDIIREASYRRHIIVHNKGIIDKKYHEKIPNSEISASPSTDSEYVLSVIASVGQFIDSLDGCFACKMHYDKEESANRILHPEAIFSIE